MSFAKTFTQFANAVAKAAGNPLTFTACLCVIVIWAASGPVFKFSDTWQLVINTGTTIVTFLMVFLIQNTQNRDAAAIQAKLDELIRAQKEARNMFVGIEHLTEQELEIVRKQCEQDAKDEDAQRDAAQAKKKGKAHPDSLSDSFERLAKSKKHA
jgi:low affinity Fe/Cu permease